MTPHADGSVRVLLVEDEPWVRESLESVLGWDGMGTTHAASAASGADALDLLGSDVEFDVALVDLGLPDMDGSVVIRAIRERSPDSVPIALTVFDDSPAILDAVRAGAGGYLRKGSSVTSLLAGIHDAANGGTPMTSLLARLIVEAVTSYRATRGRTDLGLDLITSDELDVLHAVAKGMAYAEAAAELGRDDDEVKATVRRVFRKLQVRSRADADLLR